MENMIKTLGKYADFLDNIITKSINNAQKENRQDLVDMWKTIKQDQEKHLHMLKESLEREFYK
jgi:DNA-binding ferritin-like protein